LLGPILGAFAVQYLITQIGAQQTLNANLLLGAILVGFVLLVPQGVVPAATVLLTRAFRRRSATPAAAVLEKRA
jgi:hypothetical protein